ncbi:Lysophospholipid acyltransferase 5 [Aphelenchoides fujianensis]|nr:Lysophospholipid acyltransferase 5 [Aphelenchoides fujianensis]
MGVVGALSEAINVREDGLRLIISILLGYPLSAFYRYFIFDKKPAVQHWFIVIVGIALYWFNCGWAIYHSLGSILIAFALTNYLPGTKTSVALAHICFLGHLLVGYWFEESHEYDITWTTPFCIMTLRFIGLVMDVYDGQQPKHKRNADQLKNAIETPPSLLETAAFGLFYAGTLVGPQFPLSRFRRFINQELGSIENGEVKESSLMEGCKRFVAGVTYLVFHQWGMLWVPSEFFNSAEFFAMPFFWKVFWNTVWFRAIMYRYCACWLLTEGAAILSGIAYNGKNEIGEDRWDGVRDLHIIKFELGGDFSSVIESFNCGTNTFAKNHIFKRLKGLGSRFYSQAVTLFYLAIWHGYHLGYFILFAFEFMCMFAQENLYKLIARVPALGEFFGRPYVWPFAWLFGRVMINISMAFAFLTFGLVKKEIWIKPILSMYCWGYICFFVVFPLVGQLLLRVVPSKKKREASQKTE